MEKQSTGTIFDDIENFDKEFSDFKMSAPPVGTGRRRKTKKAGRRRKNTRRRK